MSNFTQPDTAINLYTRVPITRGIQVAFQNVDQQVSWWQGYLQEQITGLTYIGYNGGSVRLERTPSQLMGANYLSFNNPTYDDKPFYCKIVGLEYENPQTVTVNFTVDYWQTFMHDAEFRSSKIDREHLSETQWSQALADPQRRDIPELFTEEPLPMHEQFELQLRAPESTDLNVFGLPRGARGTTETFGSPGGETGLTHIVGTGFGGGFYPGTEDGSLGTMSRFVSVVIQIAEYDGVMDALREFGVDDEEEDSQLLGYRNGFIRGFRTVVINPDGMIPENFSGAERGSDDDDGGDGDPVGGVDTRLQRGLDFLTEVNETHNILGIWCVPTEIMAADIHSTGSEENDLPGYPASLSFDAPRYSDISAYSDVSITNPKMHRAPFRHARIISPSGEHKSFKYEDFEVDYGESNPESGDRVVFRAVANFDDVPSMSVFPVNHNGKSADLTNRMVYDKFPQVGYVLDGFLSHVAAKHQQAALTSTVVDNYMYENHGSGSPENDWQNNLSGSLSDTLQDTLSSTVNNLTGADLFTGRTDRRLGQQEADRQMLSQALNSRSNAVDAGNFSEGQLPGDQSHIEGMFGHHRDTLKGQGEYVAGDVQGSMMIRLAQALFRLEMVTLQPEIAEQYDQFLTIYGYKSMRIGVPRIVQWMRGGDSPHFVDYDNMRFTYIKTYSLKVHSVFEPAAQYIEALFNGGVRMIDGSV